MNKKEFLFDPEKLNKINNKSILSNASYFGVKNGNNNSNGKFENKNITSQNFLGNYSNSLSNSNITYQNIKIDDEFALQLPGQITNLGNSYIGKKTKRQSNEIGRSVYSSDEENINSSSPLKEIEIGKKWKFDKPIYETYINKETMESFMRKENNFVGVKLCCEKGGYNSSLFKNVVID